jgi:hypothetical protein
MAASYRIVSVDGNEAAEQLLNETVSPNTELVQAHIQTVRQEPSDGQENTLLETTVSRFTFIFKTS